MQHARAGEYSSYVSLCENNNIPRILKLNFRQGPLLKEKITKVFFFSKESNEAKLSKQVLSLPGQVVPPCGPTLQRSQNVVSKSCYLRLHRRIGSLNMPQNEKQTFPMVEATGESIYRTVFATKCSPTSCIFLLLACRFTRGYICNLSAYLHRIGFSFPKSSRHQSSAQDYQAHVTSVLKTDRPIPIVLVKCWKVAHWNAKKLLKNCQKSKKLLPKFRKVTA